MKENSIVKRCAEKIKKKLLILGFSQEEIFNIFLLIDKTIYEQIVLEILHSFPEEKQKKLQEQTKNITDPIQLAGVLEITEENITQQYISFLGEYIADILSIC